MEVSFSDLKGHFQVMRYFRKKWREEISVGVIKALLNEMDSFKKAQGQNGKMPTNRRSRRARERRAIVFAHPHLQRRNNPCCVS